MADFEMDEAQEAQPKAKPKPKAKLKAGGGGGGPVVAISAVVALAALGVAVFMFLQFQSLKSKMLTDTGANPPGVPADAQAAEGGEQGAGASDAVQAVREEPEEIIYHLGEFTGNTSDGKFAKMDISLQIVSYYNAEDWQVYESQFEKYKEALKFWQDFENGKVDATGKPIGDHAALPTGPIPAAHGGGEAAAEAPAKPEPPAKPLSRMERELQTQDALVRSVVIDQINSHTAPQLTSPAGKEEFKQALINAINKAVPQHVGTVEDVYFSQLVTT